VRKEGDMEYLFLLLIAIGWLLQELFPEWAKKQEERLRQRQIEEARQWLEAAKNNGFLFMPPDNPVLTMLILDELYREKMGEEEDDYIADYDPGCNYDEMFGGF